RDRTAAKVKFNSLSETNAEEADRNRARVPDLDEFELFSIGGQAGRGGHRMIHDLGHAQILLGEARNAAIGGAADEAARVVDKLKGFSTGGELAPVVTLHE